MEQTITSERLSIDEVLEIKKKRYAPASVSVEGEKRMSIVTGIHGDELEGQYVCYEVGKRIQEGKEHLKGIVDIYPALNPLGIDSITRGIPMFDLDMNRIFPGNKDGSMAEALAAEIIEDIAGSDLCMDIHASNIYLKEIPQVRVNEKSAASLLPYAKRSNIDFIWIHSAATVLESTLAYSLNSIGTKTLVVEMGVGMRITKEYTRQLVEGIFILLKDLGIWDGEVKEPKKPIISTDGKVNFINAECSGIFVPVIDHWENVVKGEHIGDIIDPLAGRILSRIESPCSGGVFTLREYPVVSEGSLIARILQE